MSFRALLPGQRPLSWVSRDAWLIILARSLRTFGQSSIIILLAIYLDLLGLRLWQIGVFLSVGSAGGAFFSLVIVFIGDTMGRRRLLVSFSLLTALVGVALALTDQFLLLAAVAFVGSFAVASGGPAGPIQPLEQAALPDTVSEEKRTDLFALTGMIATGVRAAGALAAGLPVFLQSSLGLSELSSYKPMFLGYTLLAALAALSYSFLSPRVEVRGARGGVTNPFRLPSRRIIFSLAGIAALDDFATRLIVHSLVALWFFTRFDVELSTVAFIFFGSNLATAFSLWVAAKLANRIGLLNTIVFTHIPAVLMATAIPFLPSAGLAAAFWMGRGFFSQMDVPTKQSYTMAVVGSHERSALAGTNNVARSIIGTATPSLATLLWSTFSAAVPFVASGALKMAYLATFYFTFRSVRPPEEQRRLEASQEKQQARTM